MNTELFRILGTIAVDNDKANRAIDDTTGKAEKMCIRDRLSGDCQKYIKLRTSNL